MNIPTSVKRRTGALFLTLLLAATRAGSAPAAVPASNWPPVTARVKGIAADPGGSRPAVILFEEGKVNDLVPGNRVQTIHRRLKILSAEGTSRAQVRLSLIEPEQDLLELEGRTVTADGREIPLESHLITRSRTPEGVTEVEFRLPEAAPGAIIEYRYTLRGGRAPSLSTWTFQHEIPCLRSTFVWHPGLEHTSHWTLLQADALDPSVTPLTSEASPESLSAVRFEIVDLPAVPVEIHGPPAIETRARLVTTYTEFAAGPVDYWDAFAAAAAERQEVFVAQREKLAAELRSRLPEAASFDQRVRAAYDLIQEKIAISPSRSGTPAASTADSVLARGAADPEGMNLMLIAALASVDVNATRGFVVDRDQAFFHREVQSPAQFSRSLVVVTPGQGQAFFFSPGIPQTPPGLIPWYAQGVTALLAGKSGALFVTTPVDDPRVNQTTRSADFILDERGDAKALLRIDFSGQPEIESRMLNGRDPAGFRAALQGDLGRRLSKVKLDSLVVHNAGDASRNLSVQSAFSVRDFARFADDRLLLNPGVLGREHSDPFPAVTRTSPVILPYAAVTTDNVRLALPKGWKLETLPETTQFENEVGSYQALWTFDGERVVYQRVFVLRAAVIPVERYEALRSLYDHAVEGDRALLALVRAPVLPSKR
jgi:hypothetical protein